MDGLGIGGHIRRGPASQHVILQSARRLAAFGKVPRQKRVQLGRGQPVRVKLFDRFTDDLMHLAPIGPHQGLVSRLLNQRVAEGVFQLGLRRRQLDKAAGFEKAKSLSKGHVRASA